MIVEAVIAVFITFCLILLYQIYIHQQRLPIEGRTCPFVDLEGGGLGEGCRLDQQEQAAMAEFTSRVVRRSLELRRKERREGGGCSPLSNVMLLLLLLSSLSFCCLIVCILSWCFNPSVSTWHDTIPMPRLFYTCDLSEQW